MARLILSGLALTALSSAMTHTVSVGTGNALTFTPNTIMADKGDMIQFNFESDGHSVVLGDYMNPCQPMDSMAWFSGFPVKMGKSFTVEVNSTDPQWFYCSAPTHCQSGMVGVINPPSSGEDVNMYSSAAMKTSSSKAPSMMQGGMMGMMMSGMKSMMSTGMMSSGMMTKTMMSSGMMSSGMMSSGMMPTGTGMMSSGMMPTGTGMMSMSSGMMSGMMPTGTMTGMMSGMSGMASSTSMMMGAAPTKLAMGALGASFPLGVLGYMLL